MTLMCPACARPAPEGCAAEGCGPAGVTCDCDPWAAMGQYHHRYRHVRLVREPVPVRGRLGLFDLPADVEAAVREQMAVPA